MKKQILLICLTLGAGCLGMGQPWSYDFGTTSGSFSTASGTSTSFLPAPPSGTTYVRIGTGGGNINLENPGLPAIGSGSELRMVAPTGTSNNKTSLINYTAGKSFYYKCSVLMGDASGAPANSGSFYLFIGDGNTFSNANAFSGTETFSGIKWVFSGAGGITTSFRNGNAWSNLGTAPFSQENRFVLEILGNNTTSAIDYTYNGAVCSIASNKQDIYVNGLLIGDDLAKAQILNDANIDSWMFYGENSAGNVADIFLDDIVYSNSIAPSYNGNTHFYSKATGLLNLVTSWTTNQDGTGSLNPVSFEVSNTTFAICNNTNPAIGSDWVVSGAGSKIAVGDGANSCAFTTAYNLITEDLEINLNASLTLTPGKNLTTNGITSLHGPECLILQSDASGTGSFIDHGISGSGTVKVERYISAYNPGANPADGWHFLASPISGSIPVPVSFQPGTNDDLYRWGEPQNQWLNYKTNAFNFENNQGYLCAYETSGVKSFSGMVNNSNDTISDRSFSGIVEDGYGWHLFPNPFPCAILWDNTGWSATGFYSTASAKIWNSGNTYSDITNGNPIPAMNAFFLQVNSATNSIIIPTAARSHSSQNWYKSSENPLLMLVATSNENQTYAETMISFDNDATEGFDSQYDSPFLAGSPEAPQLSSLLSDHEKLSLNTYPSLTDPCTVPLGFIMGSSSSYSLTVGKEENFPGNVSILLEDIKENKIQDLRLHPVYDFTSTTGDDPCRFLLHFNGATGVYHHSEEQSIRMYSLGNSIYLAGKSGSALSGRLFVYNMLGQEMLHQDLRENSVEKITLPGYKGFCLVYVTVSGKIHSGKVLLN